MVCDNFKTFKYEKVIGHSCCTGCGGRFGCSPDNAVLLHFIKKMKDFKRNIMKDENIQKLVDKELEKLRTKVDNQRQIIKGLMEKDKIQKEEIALLKRNLKIQNKEVKK